MKINFTILIFFLSFQFNAKTQVKTEKCTPFIDSLTNYEYYIFVDTLAKPKHMELQKLLLKANFNQSPEGLVGKIVIEFFVTANGKIIGERILRSLVENEYYAQQFLKLIKSVEWNPAICNGKQVPYKYLLPINIDFQE